MNTNELRRIGEIAKEKSLSDSGQITAGKMLNRAAEEIDRLNIIISKQVDAFNKVESIVFGNFNIPVEIRDKIQRAIYHYVTINCVNTYDEGDVPE